MKDSIILLNKSDVQDEENHRFDVDTILASVKDNKNIDKLINLIKQKLSKKFSSTNNALITRETSSEAKRVFDRDRQVSQERSIQRLRTSC